MAAKLPARHRAITGSCTLEIFSFRISAAKRVVQMGVVRLMMATSACRA